MIVYFLGFMAITALMVCIYIMISEDWFMKKLKHEVDSVIVDLIMEHFNIQSFEGLKQNLTGEEFDEIIEIAKEMYYMDMLKSMKHNMPKS